MSLKELQEISDKIQGGYKTNDYFGFSRRMDNKRKWYWNIVSIKGELYAVNLNRKIQENVEL